MRILTFKKVYLIHGKQRLEWLWVFQPWFLSWNTGVTADLDSPRIWTPGPNPLADMDPPGPNPLADMDPLRRFEPPLPKVPFKYRLYHTWSLILFGSFLPIFFSIKTTFLSKGKEKQSFRSNSAVCIIASRPVYAIMKCEQTTAFELLKLFQ